MKYLKPQIYIFLMLSLIITTSCSYLDMKKLNSAMKGEHYKPINLIPMYGAPEIKKNEHQKRIDREFIESVVKSEGSREAGAQKFATYGWIARQNGNNRTSMARFNQSWLLDPDYYQPYWGFGVLMLDEKNPQKAAIYFDKALELIDDDKEKPRLLVDAARAYWLQTQHIDNKNTEKLKLIYEKANSLIDEALETDPKYANAYKIGAFIAYLQGDYRRAWSIVKKSRETRAYKFDPKFIEQLSQAYPNS